MNELLIIGGIGLVAAVLYALYHSGALKKAEDKLHDRIDSLQDKVHGIAVNALPPGTASVQPAPPVVIVNVPATPPASPTNSQIPPAAAAEFARIFGGGALRTDAPPGAPQPVMNRDYLLSKTLGPDTLGRLAECAAGETATYAFESDGSTPIRFQGAGTPLSLSGKPPSNAQGWTVWVEDGKANFFRRDGLDGHHGGQEWSMAPFVYPAGHYFLRLKFDQTGSSFVQNLYG